MPLEALREIFVALPLDSCTLEPNPVTGETGWRAPEGFAFRLTGQFRIDSTQTDPMYWYRPQESRELLIAENPEAYKNCMREAETDEEYALYLLLERIQDYHGELDAPTSFTGKWLVVDRDNEGICVKSDVHAWYDQQTIGIIHNITPDVKDGQSVVFESNEGFIAWKQLFASAILGKCKIELVEQADQKPEFFIPEPADTKTIVTAEPARYLWAVVDGKTVRYQL